MSEVNTKMEDWKKEIWEREDFQELKKLVKSYDEATAYYCESNHQMILIHLKIDENKKYKSVMDMLRSFKNYEFKIWDKTTFPIDLDIFNEDLEEYFDINHFQDDFSLNRFFIFANGNTECLISTCNIKNIEPCVGL